MSEHQDKNTPGPWHTGTGNGAGYVFGPEGSRRDYEGLAPVALMIGAPESPEVIANAKLTAAGPAMLAALRGCIHHDDGIRAPYNIPASLRRQIEAAISLAEGR